MMVQYQVMERQQRLQFYMASCFLICIQGTNVLILTNCKNIMNLMLNANGIRIRSIANKGDLFPKSGKRSWRYQGTLSPISTQVIVSQIRCIGKWRNSIISMRGYTGSALWCVNGRNETVRAKTSVIWHHLHSPFIETQFPGGLHSFGVDILGNGWFCGEKKVVLEKTVDTTNNKKEGLIVGGSNVIVSFSSSGRICSSAALNRNTEKVTSYLTSLAGLAEVAKVKSCIADVKAGTTGIFLGKKYEIMAKGQIFIFYVKKNKP